MIILAKILIYLTYSDIWPKISRRTPTMTTMQIFILLCGLAAVLYGLITSRQILSLSTGNEKMVEIANAIQEGARAYLNR